MRVFVAGRVRPHRLEVKSGSPGRQGHGRPFIYFHIPGKTHGIGVKLLVFVETTIIAPIYYIYIYMYARISIYIIYIHRSPSTYAARTEWAAVPFLRVASAATR